MKLLLIPFLMVAASLTANAHCGTCGTEKAHKKECPAECAKPCCVKKADSDKAKPAECDKAAKSEKKAPACCPTEAK